MGGGPLTTVFALSYSPDPEITRLGPMGVARSDDTAIFEKGTAWMGHSQVNSIAVYQEAYA